MFFLKLVGIGLFCAPPLLLKDTACIEKIKGSNRKKTWPKVWVDLEKYFT